MKPLFIPLKTEFYEGFERGEKREEMRLYGPRWNEKTCRPGRRVVLSKGYGKKNRLQGWIKAFHKFDAHGYEEKARAAVLACYGTLDKPMAHISIELGEPPELPCKDTIFMFSEEKD